MQATGGGYLENESPTIGRGAKADVDRRIDDYSAGLACVSGALRLSPGLQGCSTMGRRVAFSKQALETPTDKSTGLSQAPMHKSVYQRFEVGSVASLRSTQRLSSGQHARIRRWTSGTGYFGLGLKEHSSVAIADDDEKNRQGQLFGGS